MSLAAAAVASGCAGQRHWHAGGGRGFADAGSAEVFTWGRGRDSGRGAVGVCAVAAVQLISCGTLLSATYTFTGASALTPSGYIPSWGYPPNWDGGFVPPSSNSSDVAFSGFSGGQLIAVQDIADPFNLHSLTF